MYFAICVENGVDQVKIKNRNLEVNTCKMLVNIQNGILKDLIKAVIVRMRKQANNFKDIKGL